MLPPDAETFDLQTALPSGSSLGGLSAPKFDGVSTYRTLKDSHAEFSFKMKTASLLAVSYQPYSPVFEITAKVYLNGRYLKTSTHLNGQYSTSSVVEKVYEGNHEIKWILSCNGRPCPTNSIAMYQLKGLTSVDFLNNKHQHGIFTFSLPLIDGSNGFKRVSGISDLQFDGDSLYHSIKTLSPLLSYVGPGTPSLLNFLAFSNQPFRVDLVEEGKIVDSAKVPAKKAVAVNASLLKDSSPKKMALHISCQGAGQSCLPVKMFATQIVVQDGQGGWGALKSWEKLFVGSLTLTLLGALTILLGLLTRQHQQIGNH